MNAIMNATIYNNIITNTYTMGMMKSARALNTRSQYTGRTLTARTVGRVRACVHVCTSSGGRVRTSSSGARHGWSMRHACRVRACVRACGVRACVRTYVRALVAAAAARRARAG